MTTEFDYVNAYQVYGPHMHGQPIWQVFPPPYPIYPSQYWEDCPPNWYYVDKSDGVAVRFTLENGSEIIEAAPVTDPKRGALPELASPDLMGDGYAVHVNTDEYYTFIDESTPGTTTYEFIKKPYCWAEYPLPTECTDDCRLRRQCRRLTFPYGKSDDNNVIEGEEAEYTHEELDKIAEVLESDQED